MQQKKASDAQDIIFLLKYMKEKQIVPDRRHCKWVVDYDFWTVFCEDYQGAEAGFRALGLQRDSTSSPSNRSTRNSSIDLRRSISGGRH